MQKYFVTEEMDANKVPVDIEEQTVLFNESMEIRKQQMKDIMTADWDAGVDKAENIPLLNKVVSRFCFRLIPVLLYTP